MEEWQVKEMLNRINALEDQLVQLRQCYNSHEHDTTGASKRVDSIYGEGHWASGTPHLQLDEDNSVSTTHWDMEKTVKQPRPLPTSVPGPGVSPARYRTKKRK
jgi:hypothetical protein